MSNSRGLPTMSAVTLDANIARLAMGFASTDASRHYLTGIHVEPCPEGGLFVVATDRHVIGVFHDPLGTIDGAGSVTVRVPPAVAKECKPKKGEAPRRLRIEWSTRDAHDSATFTVTGTGGASVVTDTTHPLSIVTSPYPDWRRVLPSGRVPEKGEPLCFNAKLLAPFQEVAATTGERGVQRLRFVPAPSERASVAVTVPGIDWFFGALMPMRDTRASLDRPWWLDGANCIPSRGA